MMMMMMMMMHDHDHDHDDDVTLAAERCRRHYWAMKLLPPLRYEGCTLPAQSRNSALL